jgi:hypothetical protein
MSAIDESVSSSSAPNSERQSSGDASSSYDETSTTTSTNVHSNAESELASKESKQVRRSKVLFLFLLFGVTVAAGISTYILSSREEQRDFEEEVSQLSGLLVT